MQRRKFYVYIQTERQRETYCTYRFPTDGVVNIWRYLQNWFCGTVAVVCKTPSVAEGRRIALCSAHYNEAKQKKGGGEREKSAKFPNANVIALFCCLYLYYMYMYVFIQNHVQNTSLLLYIDVARFDAIFNIFLSYSLFLVFLIFLIATNMRRKRATSTATNYTHRKESQLASVAVAEAEAGAIFFRSLENSLRWRWRASSCCCWCCLDFNSLISALLNLCV